MILYKDILKDENNEPILRQKAIDVELPLSTEDINTLLDMNEYLTLGYNEKLAKRYDIRPGVGIAAPQIGVSKKMFCIMSYDEEGEFHNYLVVNPKIVSYSEELTYLESGEGCLSVETSYKGLIHRHKRIKANCYLFNPDTNELAKIVLSLKGYIAIIFQHEYDHLFGTLFFDHIDKINPFFVPENSKPITFEEN